MQQLHTVSKFKFLMIFARKRPCSNGVVTLSLLVHHFCCLVQMSSSGDPPSSPSALSLSALPTGPLASVVLYLTESELAQLLRTQKAMLTSELESDEFWRARCCSTFGQHLQHIQVSYATYTSNSPHACHVIKSYFYRSRKVRNGATAPACPCFSPLGLGEASKGHAANMQTILSHVSTAAQAQTCRADALISSPL